MKCTIEKSLLSNWFLDGKMMKKTYLATVLTLTIVGPVNAYELINTDQAYLDIYGSIKAQAKIMDEKDNRYTFGDSKIGLTSRYGVTDTLALAAGLEAEVNLDADEDKNKDDLYLSQYYAGIYSESLGLLTYGKHSTSSDDLGGVDFSEGFGGLSDLNSVGVKGDTIKYRYNNDLFKASITYGPEAGARKRELAEFYGSYTSADITFVAGIGQSSTNTSSDQTNSLYGHTSLFLDMGDYNLGATYYYNSTEDELISSRSVDKNAFALGGQLAFVENTTLYSGYEFIMQDSETMSQDGNLHNVYTGISYLIVDWTKIFTELGYKEPITGPSEVNFSLGATITF
ncbi:porin [Vibrio sp. NTOU-M3]|uniref:porin n=1 Tax=Vibrio sp. NTOU-M3 TaxID=3234954 RepID=UPI00349F19C4